MEPQVRVYVQGTQSDPSGNGEESVTRTEATGTCRRIANAWHILYEEIPPDEGDRVKCHIAVREGAVEVHRRGSVSADFFFEEGKQSETIYRTSYGELGFNVRTETLVIREEDDRLEVEIGYGLYSGDELISNNKTTIAIAHLNSYHTQ